MTLLIHKPMDHIKTQKGVAMVEFAIILPFLLLIIVGVLEIGIILIQDNTLNKSIRDSARYMSSNWNVDGCLKGIAEKVIKDNMNNMFSSTYTDSQFSDGTDTIVIEQVCINETTGATIGDPVSITANCTSGSATAFCTTAPGHVHIKASATFRHKMVIPSLLGLSFAPILTATETMRVLKP